MKRALISVFDKTGIIELAQQLIVMGWEIVSTGGTARELTNAGLPVIDISEITGFPECFDGRVKTLHPLIHGGLLALRNNESHREQLQELGIKPIDLVVNNLYPFKATIRKKGATHHEIVENIDIGGPSMLRAAAKNYQFVSVVVDPTDYEELLKQLATDNVSPQFREYLAAKVFQHTSHYDALISDYFNQKTGILFPSTITLTYERKQSMRYGENPHQQAAFYSAVKDVEGTLSEAEQLHGKELSFNNINDTNGAIEALKEFTEPTIVAVKHANPCGVGSAGTISKAFQKAYDADTISIFGGIIASNREIDEATANLINNIFIELVIAPAYSDKALEILISKKNIRILKLSDIQKNDYHTFNTKNILGGLLVQESDNKLFGAELRVVTNRAPSFTEMEDMLFAWKVVKHVKSNAIVLAKNQATVGIGPGQTNRIWALQNAIRQSEGRAAGSVIASDAFFPFSDSIEAATAAGITAIIQPGGSIRDSESIDSANKHNIAMVFTEMRHFKH